MRRRLVFALLLLAPSVGLFALAACSDSAPGPAPLKVTDDREGGKKKVDGSVEPPEEEDASVDPPEASTGPGRVYAHTKDTLYLYEPVAGELTEIAKFTFDLAAAAADIIDIAVDRTGKMYGTTFDDFFSIDPGTAKCTHIKYAGTDPLDYPNALTFVPAGTLDPGKEALVGYATKAGSTSIALTYVQIDTTTGNVTTRGNINAAATGPQYESSGDLIAIIQDANKTYATVKLRTDAGPTGTTLLAEVDPVDGHVKRIIGDTKQSDLYGFGYWAGKGYGFSDKGLVVEINMTNGSSVVVKTLASEAGAPVPWYGAGVTTQAPAR